MKITQLIKLGSACALGALALSSCNKPAGPINNDGPVAGWGAWGGEASGRRYSPVNQITPENVGSLKKVWTYRIGMLDAPENTSPTFQATPITGDGRLYVCSGRNRIVALDPETGREIWAHDAKASADGTYLLNCRGVSHFSDPGPSPTGVCPSRILAGTLDGRLIALDAATGKFCSDFGEKGSIDLTTDLGKVQAGDFGITSPPAIIGNMVVVGGRIPDNMRTDTPAGVVRAYDVHTGKQLWSWNPLPPGQEDAALAPKGEHYVRATPNAWAPLSVDPALGLVYVPTGNAAPDHYAADRNGRDYYASSVVALDAKTGTVKWHFQTVHHDVWDYDVPAQPVLFDLPTPNGATIPALAQATKQGHIFILNRATGQPVFPVEERPVPQDALPGERLSPTQPFPANPAFIVRRDLTEDDMWGFTPWDRGKCVDQFRSARWQGVFTPPSTKGTIFYPSFMGTSNWGSVSIDQENGVLIANTTHVPAIATEVPRKEADARMAKGDFLLPVTGAPYAHTMKPMLSPLGAPCVKPPWGTLLAIDLKQGKRLWEVPLGTTRDVAPFPIWRKMGVPNLGGSIITGSGLVFIGAATDNFLRAFNVKTGEELWKGRLPAGGQATPMTYRLTKNGRQYVVIAAGGHKYLGTTLGDHLVAFALPE